MADARTGRGQSNGPRSEWARRYPPLTGVLLASLLAVVLLPSALNVPQTNPQETLEFAPVPPEDDDAPPPDQSGDISSVGLGSSRGPAVTAPGGGPGGPAPLPPAPGTPGGTGSNPQTKRCVGDPPKQTEDPMAPPCVGFFEGDNFGATAPGVTADEIRVVFYTDGSGCTVGTSRGQECRVEDRIDDLALPEAEDEFLMSRTLRRYQRYFNERFQTYSRNVHFYVHYSTGGPFAPPEVRRADAERQLGAIDPAIAVSIVRAGPDAYLEVMQQAGRITIAGNLEGQLGSGSRPIDVYQRFPGFLWGFEPTLEKRADLFLSHVCNKVVGHPVSYSGNGDIGQPRKLGILTVAPERFPEIAYFGELVTRGLEDCGADIVEDGTFPNAECPCPDSPHYGVQNMAAFQSAGVTTIVQVGGVETNHSQAAGSLNYRPEWVIASDNRSEINSRFQDQTVYEHVRVISTYARSLPLDRRPCRQAMLESDPSWPERDSQNACGVYQTVRFLFTGIQVAGPRLTQETFERGFRAIPPIASTSPFVPACFLEPGDYTCVKDAMVIWWDPDAPGEENDFGTPGCWRMVEEGKRYLAGTWPEGDIDAQRRADGDPCHVSLG